jgi:D-beta-D-heptose 7-phosphate kinase/D-beta-D-heptose 1-phosphate adenosyltransferase
MTELKNTRQQKQFSVLLVGDSCVDEYCYGSIDRLSPEAPVPVLKFLSTTVNPGMAANVKENLLAFGLEVDFITNGEKITKTRYVEIRSGQHMLRVDHDMELLPWSGYLPSSLDEYDAIVISDYNKGFVTYEAIEKLRTDFQGPIFIDTKKQDLARFNGCYVKINELEYKASTSQCENLIVTKGRLGAMYKNTMYAAVPQEVVDVCGAGDTFLSAVLYEYLNTNCIVQAIEFANKCSAITVGHRGVYVLSSEDIQKVKTT